MLKQYTKKNKKNQKKIHVTHQQKRFVCHLWLLASTLSLGQSAAALQLLLEGKMTEDRAIRYF